MFDWDNSMILPRVKLGDNTIIGAGSVVTKSFAEGNLVIASDPTKELKKL
jgi:acetyltransferase-like isoleucine patch superfamily enzyme